VAFVDHTGQLLIMVSYETISDLMTLQDQIDAFQKLYYPTSEAAQTMSAELRL
jgi:hypothetical protein